MSSTSHAVHEGVAELKHRVHALEERLCEVERRLGIEAAAAVQQQSRQEDDLAAPMPSLVDNPAATMVLAGKSLFGLAVAYLLRALTENNTIPASRRVRSSSSNG